MFKKLTLFAFIFLMVINVVAQTKKPSKTFTVDQNVSKYLEKNVLKSKFAVYFNVSDIFVQDVMHFGVNYKITDGIFAELGIGFPISNSAGTSSHFNLFGSASSAIPAIADKNESDGKGGGRTYASDFNLVEGKMPLFYNAGIFRSLHTNTIASTVYYGAVINYNKYIYKYTNEISVLLSNSLNHLAVGPVLGRRSTLLGISRLQIDFNLGVSYDMYINSKNGSPNDLLSGGSKNYIGAIINLRLLGLIK